jgi:Tub family
MNSPTFCSRSDPPFFSQIDLESYDATSLAASSLSDGRDGIVEIKSHLKNRFTVYQRRLEALLAQNDSSGFEECLLDFWDEFLPTTANIHFHDRNTAVPRTSKLENFVSKPCPKAIGIVQCEIERIKIKSKKKGVNVTGRLFPTYEYRLFIRDRRSDSSSPESAMNPVNPTPRHDTIIMVAKNRGRKHQETRVILPAPGASKKGVNNYYLYLPQQVDVDTHYRVVNNDDEAELMPNGANLEIPTRTGDNNAPVLQGRLQSNFIGTEFQIFIPIIRKHPVSVRKPVTLRPAHVLSSDSESDYEVLSDTTSPTNRRNRFYRTKSSQDLLRRNNQDIFNVEANHPEPISEEESVGSGPTSVRRLHKRGYSLPNFPYRRSIRSSRRVVAHSIEPPIDPSQTLHPIFCEEEDGAITYSANLLGNRPRVMDVCVPRVSDDGTPGAEWKRHLGSIEDSADAVSNSMLSHFKQLQQRHESADHGQNDAHEDFGLLALQNRPPWWNDELQAFVLNFGGRVSVASVKNFQLCDRTDHDRIMLQFGRIQGRHSFTMDFQYPLTAVQAFAIAISSLQSKISFG